MNMIREHEEELKTWKDPFSPHAMEIFNDNRKIAQVCRLDFNGDDGYEVTQGRNRHTVKLEEKSCTCRCWDVSGIPCQHAIKALTYRKQNPRDEIHWWYSREAYSLVYKHKLQPVRGDRFWKVLPEHAMEPPQITNMAGRPKIKRKRQKNEAKKRQSLWAASREGLKMPCGFCSASGHNIRRCPLVNGPKKNLFNVEESVLMSGPQASSSTGFMPTPTFKKKGNTNTDPSSSKAGNASTNAPSLSKAGDASKSAPASSKSSKRPCSDVLSNGPSKQAKIGPSTQDSTTAIRIQSSTVAAEDSEEEVEDDTVIRPKCISEDRTRMLHKMRKDANTGERKIGFVGPNSKPKLPFEPMRVSWRGKEAVLGQQLQALTEKKLGKLQVRRAKGI